MTAGEQLTDLNGESLNAVIQLLVQRAKQRLISGGHSRALVPAWQSLQRIGAAEVRRDAALRNK